MKKLLSCEIGRKYENTVSFYRKKDDGKPAFSLSLAYDYRLPLRRLLLTAAIAAAATALLFGAKLEAGKKQKGKSA